MRSGLRGAGHADSPAAPTIGGGIPPPVVAIAITSVSPSTGITAAAEGVEIRGRGFKTGVVVTFGTAPAAITSVNPDIIRVVTRALSAGPVDVVVTNPDGTSATLSGGYSTQPVVLTVQPGQVARGAPLSVTWSVVSSRSELDWIGLFAADAPNESYQNGWWTYTHGATSGTFTINAPANPGVYEFRYLLDDWYDDVARSTVTVKP